MVIVLLWLGLICCGMANGLIYDYVEASQSYYYLVAIGIVNAIILVYHRIYTREWCKPPNQKKTKKKPQIQRHFQVFGMSAMFSSAMFLSTVLCVKTNEVSWGVFAGSATAMVSFFIATARESYYV